MLLTESETKSAAVAASPLRVALVGCGAISEQFHLPVLAGHDAIRLAAVVDRHAPRVNEVARGYRVSAALTDTDGLNRESVDAVVIATPPTSHAPLAIDLLRRGLHVFVEKPMAVTSADAEAMVRAAEESGAVLAVGLYRRLLPVTRLLRALVEKQSWGRPLCFEAEWGGIGGYASASLGPYRKEQAGGGVLLDLGTHLIDQLLYVFPGRAEVLECRTDDFGGGVEADCEVRLRLTHDGRPVEGRIVLSRARNLRGYLRVECERATLETPINERYHVRVRPADLRLEDPATGEGRNLDLRANWDSEPETAWYEAFRAEIDDWLTAIRAGRPPELSGPSAVPTVRLVEECYRRAVPVVPAWVKEGVDRREPISTNGQASHAPAVVRSAVPFKRVLVTGAGGFIGGRVAEILALGDGVEVRAMVHNAGSAARLARLPVEMVQGDLKSDADVTRAVEGCDAVVHCAVGTAYGQRREIFAVTVGGTQRLAEAALKAGAGRFVHVSSIGVHGNGVRGVIDASTPIRPDRGDEYSESKTQAEDAVRRAVRRGLKAVVLRPGCVYGPYGKTFVMNPLAALVEGRLVLSGSADTPSNTVYVDNVAEAIRRALLVPAEVADGRAYPISDGDEWTWGEFFDYFARELGAKFRQTDGSERPPAPRRRWIPGAGIVRAVRAVGEVAVSPEMRGLLRKALNTDPLGWAPRFMLERFPFLERWLRRLFRVDAPVVYHRPPAQDAGPLEILPRHAVIRTDDARRDLGYTPAVARDRAMALTLDWVRFAGLVPEAR